MLNCSSILDDNSNIDDFTFEYIVKHPKEVMIILDGYDEYSQQNYIAGNSEQQHPNNARCKMPMAALCSKLIKGNILKGAIVMITSRPDESDKIGGITFKRYVEIAGFSARQVREYIEKYFKKNDKMKSAVLEHVMKNENLVSFAHVLMLCYLLCFEMEFTLTESADPHKLPVSTTDIYTKLVDIFELKHSVESEYRQKEIPEQFNPPSVIKNTMEKLSKLAAKLLVERKPTFDESEVEGDFESEEVKTLKGSGLLYCGKPFRTTSITITKHYSFTHLTVQEFLAARWFVKENCVPDKNLSEMVFQFMAGIFSSEENEELMEKLIATTERRLLRMKCLNEYQDKEFAKRFIRSHPEACCDLEGSLSFRDLSDVDCIAVSFVLDMTSDLNKEEAGKAKHEYPDKSVAVKMLHLEELHLTLSGLQRIYNSLINKHCLVSDLVLSRSNLTAEHIDVINRLVVKKLISLELWENEITDTAVASLCESLKHQSCALTTLDLGGNKITDTGVASLCQALQHPSCKLTRLYLGGNQITDTGVASLCEVLLNRSCQLTTLRLRFNYSISRSSEESLRAIVRKYRTGFELEV